MNASDGPGLASPGQADLPAAATPPADRHMEAEPGLGAGTHLPREVEPSGHKTANTDRNRPPGRGIQAWACLRLPDGTQRLAAIPASPTQASTEQAGRVREPELEAEP